VSADQLAFLDALQEGYLRALDNAAVVERHFGIAGFRIALKFAGPGLLPAITPALEHLEIPPAGTPDLDICLFDSASTASRLPFLLDHFMQRVRSNWWEYLGSRRELTSIDGERIRSAFHPGPDILSVFDRETDRALYWVPDASRIPYYETGYPLSVILNWWLTNRGRYFVHAACVGDESGAALITGRGGSGKSTTTLACVDAGLSLCGDDYCVVAPGNPAVFSLYNTVKLKGLADVDRFSHLKHCVSNLDQVDDSEEGERAVIYLQRHFPDQLMASSRLRAILVPRIVDRETTEIGPISQAEVFRAIMPSTVFQLPGDARATFGAMARFCRSVPAYGIALGRDIPAIPGVIRRFLHELEARA